MEIIQHNDENFWSLWYQLSDSVDYTHPVYSDIGISFYKEYFFKKEKVQNRSFLIINNDTPVLGAIMSLDGIDKKVNLSGFGRGIIYIENNLGNIDGIKGARKVL